MNDFDTLLRETLSTQAATATAPAALATASIRRSRQLHRRAVAVSGVAGAGLIGAGAVGTAAVVGNTPGHSQALDIYPLSAASTRSATPPSADVPTAALPAACPSGEVALVITTSDVPVRSGPGAGPSGLDLSQRYVHDMAGDGTATSFVAGEPAVDQSGNAEAWVISGQKGQATMTSVVIKPQNTGWAAFPATYQGCIPESSTSSP